MKFLTSLRGERLLAELKTSGELTSPQSRKVVEKLINLKSDAIPIVLEALGSADKRETMAFVEVLAALADSKNLPALLQGLADSNARTVAAVAWALSSAKGFPATELLPALKDPDIAGAALIDVIGAHKSRIPLRELLAAAYNQDSGDKAALFKIIGEVADPASVPDLLARLEGQDVGVRTHQSLSLIASSRYLMELASPTSFSTSTAARRAYSDSLFRIGTRYLTVCGWRARIMSSMVRLVTSMSASASSGATASTDGSAGVLSSAASAA